MSAYSSRFNKVEEGMFAFQSHVENCCNKNLSAILLWQDCVQISLVSIGALGALWSEFEPVIKLQTPQVDRLQEQTRPS